MDVAVQRLEAEGWKDGSDGADEDCLATCPGHGTVDGGR